MTLNRPFDWFFFQLLTWKSSGNSIDTTEKSALKLVACLASVSNRVMARKLEREQKTKRWKGEGEGRRGTLPSPVIPFFLLSSQLFSTNSRGNACYAGYKISKIAKFESDNLLKTKEYAAHQSREILQRFVWWGTINYHFEIWQFY